MKEENDPDIPVIVGVGQVNDRTGGADRDGLDSLGLMAEAARAAGQDAGGSLLARCDWLAIIPQISFPGLDVPGPLAQALGISPKQVDMASMASGDTPVRYLNDAANAIGSGKAQVALIVGGEGLRTAGYRAKLGTGGGGGIGNAAFRNASELRKRYGLINPTDIYPLYENASRAAWGQTLAEGQTETGLIWSLMSQVAARSEGAWLKQARSAEDILRTDERNRPIVFPYNKLMVANSSVNQGAALLVTSRAVAREAGIPEHRLVYIGLGAAAHELDDPLARSRWDASPSMRVSLERAMQLNELNSSDLDCVELYSCFPCVPKMARRVIGWPAEKPATVHGGLTFGGGPVGNYMTHAAAGMVQALRQGGTNGLLFGNGGYCTHNHCIVLSRKAPVLNPFPQEYHFQTEADAARGDIPALGDEYQGELKVETYTVVYDRNGAPNYGVVMGRSGNHAARVIARVDKDDAASIAFLTDGRSEPVGSKGHTAKRDGILYWQLSA